MTHRYFATTSKGLENVLAEEVRALGGKRVDPSPGGVAFSGTVALCYRANLWLRTANRVLLSLSAFRAPTPESLYEGTKAVPWPDLFPVDCRFAVEASVRDSGITHSHFAAQKVKDAVADRFRERFRRRPDVDTVDPQVRIHLRIHRDECTLSLDTSGESLNRRGYREDPSSASLRETLAAGVVALAGWDGTRPLADPMCGAGTILIEAALLAAGRAPGLLRSSFGFQRLAGFDRKAWERILAEARERPHAAPRFRIEGSDRSEAAVRGARRNARRAGVDRWVRFRPLDLREFAPEGPPGIILCNPPYGVRMGKGTEEETFYRAMGEAFKKRCRGWTAYVLSGNPEATRHIGLKASRRIPLMNGPIDCRLLKYDLY
ncbi:MAG TPA: THUMP domain-containing protein [Candidatus Deferrimicrobiaceae bacterium]|nr:THUMP domain-containing protein [Candidatus Deferrimicrobiaceae bacterium]